MESAPRRIIQSIVVGILALAMCIVTVVVVQQTTVVPAPSLAGRLPATGALLFLKGTSMDDLAGIDRLLGLEGKLSAPLPKLGSGAYELAVMERGGAWEWVLQTVRGNDVSVSGPAADLLSANGTDRSHALRHLRSFSRMLRQPAPAVWMDMQVFPLTDTHPDRLLQSLLQPYSHAMLGLGTPRTLVLVRTERKTLPSRPVGPLGRAPSGALDIIDPALGQRLAALSEALRTAEPELHEGVAGILAHAWQRALGSMSAQAAAGLTGHLAGIRVEPGGDAPAIALALQDVSPGLIDALLESFAAELPQTAVRTLDLKLNTRTDVTVDADAVERGGEDLAGWRLRWVQSKNTDGRLAAAERGTRTLLSTDLELLRRMVAETAPATGTGAVKPAVVQAGGIMTQPLFVKTVERTLPLFKNETESFFWRMLEAGGDFRWTILAQADADVVTIEEGR